MKAIVLASIFTTLCACGRLADIGDAGGADAMTDAAIEEVPDSALSPDAATFPVTSVPDAASDAGREQTPCGLRPLSGHFACCGATGELACRGDCLDDGGCACGFIPNGCPNGSVCCDDVNGNCLTEERCAQ